MNIKKALIIIIALLYLISPVDLMPGLLIDDLAIIAVGAITAFTSAGKPVEEQKRIDNE